MILGIDLGTTHTLASYIKDSKLHFLKFTDTDSFLLPSVIALSGGKFIVGEKAKEIWLKNPYSAVRSIKSYIGKQDTIDIIDFVKKEKKTYKTEELYSKILVHLKQVAEKQLEQLVKDVVISVPAFFDDIARKKTKEVAELAGFNVVRLINEPTAASLGYGFYGEQFSEHKVIVYDFGGGTFDVSLLEINGGVIEIIASDGDRTLGGSAR